MSDQNSSTFKTLLENAQKGYLTQNELMNLLPSSYVEPEKIEDVISKLNSMGIKVLESEASGEALKESTELQADELQEAAEVLATESRTTDPVRMYMREMGKVDLLTRAGEIKIAQIVSGQRRNKF